MDRSQQFATDSRYQASSRERLDGSAHFDTRIRFPGWSRWMDTYRELRDAGIACIAHPNATEQYLVDSGRGLFREMRFEQLVRVQVDIETLGLNPIDPDARIVMIAISTNGDDAVVLRADDLDEARMIDALNRIIAERDPDVIEGHNLFNFDLPYLGERARQVNRLLTWGREGSPVRVARGTAIQGRRSHDPISTRSRLWSALHRHLSAGSTVRRVRKSRKLRIEVSSRCPGPDSRSENIRTRRGDRSCLGLGS